MLNLQGELQKARESGRLIIFIVYFSLFLDNMLLSVVVPIIPDYLYNMDHNLSLWSEATTQSVVNSSVLASKDYNASHESSDLLPEDIINENARVGLLFSSKALVQLVANPFVGIVTNRIGFTIPMILGSGYLFVSSMVFAVSKTYGLLFFARSLQGIGSACFAISGMSMLAAIYPDDRVRSHVMGVALGGMAMGVLVGYPFGGLMYDFVGKEAPFVVISVLLLLDAALQVAVLRPVTKAEPFIGTSIYYLLKDPNILIVAGAVCVSTSAMAVLEPCLPIWLMDTVKPKKWQLGTVFVPDSLGYLVGSNLGVLTYKLGRWLTAVFSLILVGICSNLVPFATAMSHLIFPHFGLGLGIGLTDAALMPLLAHLVDTRHVAVYGSVYAIAQVAVSLAYSLGPLVGGEVVKSVGFPWLMRTVGILNLLYCPLCLKLRESPIEEENQAIIMANPERVKYSNGEDLTRQKSGNRGYHRFSVDSTESE